MENDRLTADVEALGDYVRKFLEDRGFAEPVVFIAAAGSGKTLVLSSSEGLPDKIDVSAVTKAVEAEAVGDGEAGSVPMAATMSLLSRGCRWVLRNIGGSLVWVRVCN